MLQKLDLSVYYGRINERRVFKIKFLRQKNAKYGLQPIKATKAPDFVNTIKLVLDVRDLLRK